MPTAENGSHEPKDHTVAQVVRLTAIAKPIEESCILIASFSLMVHGNDIEFPATPANKLVRLSFQHCVERDETKNVSQIEGQMFTIVQALTLQFLDELILTGGVVDEEAVEYLRQANTLALTWK